MYQVSGIRYQVSGVRYRVVYQQPDLEFWRIYLVPDDVNIFADVV